MAHRDGAQGAEGGADFRMPPPGEAERARAHEARTSRMTETGRVGWAAAGLGAAWTGWLLAFSDRFFSALYFVGPVALVLLWKALRPDRIR